jgi:hypothetical protein
MSHAILHGSPNRPIDLNLRLEGDGVDVRIENAC